MKTIRDMYKSGFTVDFPGMPIDEFSLSCHMLCAPDWKFFNGDKLERQIAFKGPDIYSWDDEKRCYFQDNAGEISTFSRISIEESKI